MPKERFTDINVSLWKKKSINISISCDLFLYSFFQEPAS